MSESLTSIILRHRNLIRVSAAAAAAVIAVVILFTGCDSLLGTDALSPAAAERGLNRRSASSELGPESPRRKSLKPYRSRYGRIYTGQDSGEHVLVMGPDIQVIESSGKPRRNADGSITIPAAINCILIDRVVFSVRSRLRTIGRCAFCDHRIRKLKIPEGVTDIGKYAFAYNDMEILRLPESLKEIGYYAFAYNKLSTEVRIPKGVTRIGPYAFKGNASLNVTIALQSLRKTPENAFPGTAVLNDYNGKRIIFDSASNSWIIRPAGS